MVETTPFLRRQWRGTIPSLSVLRHILQDSQLQKKTHLFCERLPEKKLLDDTERRMRRHWCFMFSVILGGGFKYFLCSPLLWGRFPFWFIFFKWVGSTTNQNFYMSTFFFSWAHTRLGETVSQLRHSQDASDDVWSVWAAVFSEKWWGFPNGWPVVTIVNDEHMRLTPWKINMEPTNHPFRKENDLPNLHDHVPC